VDAIHPRPERSGSLNPLDQFRGPGKRLKIHGLELALLWAVAAHLIFLPWAIGGMRLWSQWISLGFGVTAFALSLWPREYTAEHTGMSSFRVLPWPKLLKFPIFWLGLALLVLVVIHGANPAWEYQTRGKTWWMHRIAHINWLPAGVRVPFELWGPWRMLLIYASGWLTVCAIWVGFTRRRTIQRLFIALAINGVALSVFGLAERMTHADKLYWLWHSSNPSFFASFVYKNHAGAYLNLALAIACGIAAWHHVRSVRRLEKSNPSGVFAFLATCIGVSILVSYARGATFVMLSYLCLVVIGFIIHQVRLPKDARQPWIALALLLVFGFFLKTGLQAVNSDEAFDRLKHALSGQDVSWEAREVATQAASEMLRHDWKMGAGSGSFAFLFPIYQQHYPFIATNQFWEHAHNDILEIPIELGLPGMLLVFASFAYWGVALLRAYAWQNPLSASVILGCLFMMGMAWGDFVFQCPAVLITWCALWPACTLWAKFEEQRGRG
jgi:hypothetical protein